MNLARRLYWKFSIFHEEQGQDLIEYALLVALIALAATAGMQTLPADMNAAFTSVGNKLNTYVS
jgi:pilus assembly protein Flp/PilA